MQIERGRILSIVERIAPLSNSLTIEILLMQRCANVCQRLRYFRIFASIERHGQRCLAFGFLTRRDSSSRAAGPMPNAA